MHNGMPALSRLVLLLVVLLTGCEATIHDTKYTPPDQPAGRMCLRQCQEARDYCQQGCGLTERRCVNRMQTQAIRDYEQYARETFLAGGELDLRPSDFERPQKCAQSECTKDCDAAYRSCYAECGGTVKLETSCQFMCF
jgi:hypothetical protein